jgi:g-D-glutamyl-meso-diaminopimelate peptidase
METRALAELTEELEPDLVLAYHSQGKEIYWKFKDYAVPGAEELGQVMAKVSGYKLAEVPYESAFAGYKDWFIQNYRRPGYTVEVGIGTNPLPLSQFSEIYRDNVPLLNIAALGIKNS